MDADAIELDVFTDDDGYYVVGPCTPEQALALMREHAAANGDSEGPAATSPAELITGWVSRPVLDAPEGDPLYPRVAAGTSHALPVTSSLY